MPRGLHHGLLNPNGGIVFCLGGAGAPIDRASDAAFDQTVPWYAVPMLRPGIDIAIVPFYDGVQNIVYALAELLGLESWQIQIAPGTFAQLETCVCGNMEAELKQRISLGSWVLVTYHHHPGAVRLSRRLGIPLVCDSWEWRENWGKRCLHPHINLVQNSGPSLEELSEFCVPRGFMADTTDELLEASRRLRAGGVKKMLLKPVDGDGGVGIEYFSAIDDGLLRRHGFAHGTMILEENVVTSARSAIVAPSIHICGGHVGVPARQALAGDTFLGLRYPSGLSDDMCQSVVRMARAFVQRAQPTGLGGLDFIQGTDGHMYLIDLNVGRMTEAMPLIFCAEQHGQELSTSGVWMSRKFTPESDNLPGLLQQLTEDGLLLPAANGAIHSGVMPIVYRKDYGGMFVAYGTTSAEARELLDNAVAVAQALTD